MIGWYVHHHGRGHLTRATAVAARLDVPVVGLSTLPGPGAPFADWVQLPPDEVPGADDPTASGVLHWAPRRAPATADRLAALTAWLAAARPTALVVDVGVEATVAARLAGVPVALVALPGDRGDDPHQLAFRLADRILCFWPRKAYDPGWLAPWAAKVRHLGAVSRFDDRPRTAVTGGVVLLRGGGDDPGAAPWDAPAGWRVLAGDVADPWPVLCGADVVVTHAGQNALAEVAAARRPAVVVAADRPFAEQRRTAEALQRSGIAVGVDRWPAPGDWPGLLDRARALGGDGWTAWSSGAGAQRAAEEIGALA